MTLDAQDYDLLRAETGSTEGDPYETYRTGQWRQNAEELSICDIEWEDGLLEVEFSRSVQTESAWVSVAAAGGSAAFVDILEREEDELLLDLSSVSLSGVVTLTVGGLKLPDGTEAPRTSALLRMPSRMAGQAGQQEAPDPDLPLFEPEEEKDTGLSDDDDEDDDDNGDDADEEEDEDDDDDDRNSAGPAGGKKSGGKRSGVCDDDEEDDEDEEDEEDEEKDGVGRDPV